MCGWFSYLDFFMLKWYTMSLIMKTVAKLLFVPIIFGVLATVVFPMVTHATQPPVTDDIDEIRAYYDNLGGIVAQWFNGTYQNNTIWDYSTDYAHPNYGTHDWIAEHAKNWLPTYQREFIDNNLNAYLLGTEAPDNADLHYLGNGYGDFQNHINYYTADFTGGLSTPAATRALEEFNKADAALPGDENAGAYYAGTMSHYIDDPAVFGHVMGDGSPLGTEHNHSNFERGVDAWTLQYNGGFFERYLTPAYHDDRYTNAHSASYYIGLITAKGEGNTKSAQWMDANFPGDANTWDVNSNPTYTNSVGDSLNRAVQATADVLSDLALRNGYSLKRLSGKNRFESAVAVSQEQFPTTGSAGAVFLARSDQYADALAAAPLIAQKNGTLLLTQLDALPDVSSAELQRALGSDHTKKIFLLGGTAMISSAQQTNIANTFGYPVTRLAGADRIDTAITIANKLNDKNTAFIINKDYWADSISVSAPAVKTGYYILPTAGTTLDSRVADFITSHTTITNAIVVGGTSGLSATIVNNLTSLGLSVERIAGSNRYETNRLLAERFFPTPPSITFADGDSFMDGLTGAAIAASNNAPMILVPSFDGQSIVNTTYPYLNTHHTTLTTGLLVGGTSVISRPEQLTLGIHLY